MRIRNNVLFQIIFILLLGTSWDMVFSQDSVATSAQDQRINFSFVPTQKTPSIQPYYDALNTATYGEQRFSVFDQLAAHYVENGVGDSVMKYGNLYLKEVLQWDKAEEIKKNYAAIANFWQASGNRLNGLPDNAIKWHIKGITNATVASNTLYAYKHKIGLNGIYIQQENYDKAIAGLEKAMKAHEEELPNVSNEALMLLGDAYFYKKEYPKAKEIYNKALAGSSTYNELKQELSIQLKLGYLEELNKKFDAAFQLYNETRIRAQENGLNLLYFEGTARLGELLYKQGNYDAAIMALSITYINTVERENLHYQARLISIQARIFSAKGDYKNAYALATQLRNVERQIQQQQEKKISKELEVQYETLEKEKEILALEETQLERETELQRQRTIKNAFLIGFLIILIPVIGLLYLYYQKLQTQSLLAAKQEEVNLQKVAALKQDQELNLIKTSIVAQDEERKRIAQELHDSIGGNLAGIKLQLSNVKNESNGIKNISEQIDETYQLVRDISHTLVPKKFQENTFTTLLNTYVSSISTSGKLQIEIHAHPEDKINAMPEQVRLQLYKVIQELITNTVKHAKASQIDLHLNGHDDHVNLLFEDNGEGFDTALAADGMGLTNIKKRIKDLNGLIHFDATKGRGTVVSAEIPLKL